MQVRKACHHAVGVVLRGSTFVKTDSNSAMSYHPAAADVAKFCREEIEKCSGLFTELPLLAFIYF